MQELKLGEQLPEDVYVGKCLLIKKGALITEALLRTFENFGVTLEQPTPQYNFQDFTDTVRLGVLKLDLDAVVDCARDMVDDMIENKFSHELHLVFDYDECTYTHSRNVALLSIVAGMQIGYTTDQLKTLAVGALLHDIGKLQVPLEILNKPGRLTRDEFDIIKRHPKLGYDILNTQPGISTPVKQIVLQHHENNDGSGYPRKLSSYHGYKLANLVHIADVYEAMCATRPYKKPIPRDEVKQYLVDNKYTMFNPEYVDKFLQAVPSYLSGEALMIGGNVCIVVTSENDPIVQCNGNEYRLSELSAECKQSLA